MTLYLKTIIVFISLIFFQTAVFCQQSFVGKVIDSKLGEAIVGAVVLRSDCQVSTVTNSIGLFKLPAVSVNAFIRVSYIGYNDTVIQIKPSVDTLIVKLTSKINEIEAVTVSSTGESQRRQTGLVTLRMKEVKEIATLFGTADPLKLLQLKPGMTLSNEGDGGIYVRGGENGQNLVLLDGIPLHNPTHLLGFYSVFHEGATREISMYKSAPPARFGGKLSSVIDVSMVNKTDSLLEGDISTGLMSSSLTLKGTNTNKRLFYMVSARQAYLGVIKAIMKPISASASSFMLNTDYGFGDYYTVLRYQTSNKSALSVSAYLGNDDYRFSNTTSFVTSKLNWGNAGSSARWNVLLGNGLDVSVSATYSAYSFAMKGSNEQAIFKLTSNLEQWMLRAEAKKTFGGTVVNSGIEFSSYLLKPNRFSVQADEQILSDKQTYHSRLYSPYIQVDWRKVGPWMLSVGMRTPLYLEVGPTVKYLSDSTNLKSYASGDIVFRNFEIEPRVNLTYQLYEYMSIKSSWSRLSQPLHQIPVGSVSLPTDFWISSTKEQKPSLSTQYTLGWFANYPGQGWELSAEVYHRKLERLVELNMVYFNNPSASNFSKNLFTGNGYAYGLEFYVKKKTERYLAWISYVYSRSFRHFDELQSTDYPAKYDRPHDLKLVQRYILSPKWTVSAVWVYASGNTLSLPVGRYLIQGNMMNDYGAINNFRLPAYHRLDVSATRNIKWFKYNGEFNMSVYNVYNRSNPYFYYYRVSGNFAIYYLKVQLRRVSLFPILPSVSLKFYF